MAGIKGALSLLAKAIRPDVASKEEAKWMRDAMLNAKFLSQLETTKGNPKLSSAHSMIMSALKPATAAAKWSDEELRLLALPDEDMARAALSYRTPGYFMIDNLPKNAVYVESLGSVVPGGGSQLLREVAKRHPAQPVMLEAKWDEIPGGIGTDTIDFYLRRGFIPQEKNLLNPISPYPMMVLPEGRQMKKEGGLIQMTKRGPSHTP